MKTNTIIPEVINPYDLGYSIHHYDMARIYQLVRNAKKSGIDTVLVASTVSNGTLTTMPCASDDMDNKHIVCNINQLNTRSYKTFAETLQKMLLAPTNGKLYDTELVQTIAGICSDYTNIFLDGMEADEVASWHEHCNGDFVLTIADYGETAVAEAIDLLKPYAITKFGNSVVEMTLARLHKQAA